MAIELHDTLTRTRKTLVPSDGQTYRFYCCGPTVYGPAHIGNFRAFVAQDVLRRVLETDFLAHTAADAPPIVLKHVRNITDVDDKTIRTSQERGETLTAFTQRWTEKFHTDCAALNCLTPDVEPRATAHIPQQVALVENLLAGGFAYVGGDGSVYFKVSACSHYGELSHLDRDQLQTQTENSAGQANDADEYDRESVSDFALWKAHKPEDGDNQWPGPKNPATGESINGRPGWHLECSAMSTAYLGESFDLHGGGVDLCFPHHENEIAQSESASGQRPFCHHWFHNAHLMVEGKKMSKSLGNLYTLEELDAQGYSAQAVRYVLINGHYRSQLNFTFNGLTAAASALAKLEKALKPILDIIGMTPEEFRELCGKPSAMTVTGMFVRAWEHLSDDLNVPGALGDIFSCVGDLNDPSYSKSAIVGQLRSLAGLLYCLGLELYTTPEAPIVEAPEHVIQLAAQRWEAKQSRDFTAADALRAEIQAAGWIVLDRKDGYDLSPA
ncbi:cysteine--tRNA ligase [Cerasicoccus arenae]|uniref:Cysteine--tRNA ligase n=1 Tax=Cerasicoccus arenae TaxID=424488 RepID=A0A8J3GCP5_9BACT|nr:cysteine--tRNA ligase [Cerasicoccus arenae]MBK1857239.1 cysteine--tRNA ligase [Cerasicoccus arenae]GHC00203.1 cysteine--tRNA ligase [Cerasicoccus arenae]